MVSIWFPGFFCWYYCNQTHLCTYIMYLYTSGCSKCLSEQSSPAARRPQTSGFLIDFQEKVPPSASLVKMHSLVSVTTGRSPTRETAALWECCMCLCPSMSEGLVSEPPFLACGGVTFQNRCVCLHSSWHGVWLHASSTVSNPGCLHLDSTAYSDSPRTSNTSAIQTCAIAWLAVRAIGRISQ